MKGATGHAFVDNGGGNNRCSKTYVKSYTKYLPKGFASAKTPGPVGGGYPANLGGSKENGGGGMSAKGGDVSAAVGVGEKLSATPPGAGGGVGAGGGGVLEGTSGIAAKGGFKTKPFGEGDSNQPPSPFGGGERGRGMVKTTVVEGVSPDKSPAISMANIMKGWTRENGGGGGSQSMPSDGSGGDGDGYLPDAASRGRSPPLPQVRIYLLCAHTKDTDHSIQSCIKPCLINGHVTRRYCGHPSSFFNKWQSLDYIKFMILVSAHSCG
jgi:hypothetical protein